MARPSEILGSVVAASEREQLETFLDYLRDAVVRKAMAKKVAERYQSAAEFSAAIRDVVSGRSADATLTERLPAARAAEPKRWRRKGNFRL